MAKLRQSGRVGVSGSGSMFYRFARFLLFAIPCAGLLGLVVLSKNKAAVGSPRPRSMTLSLAPDSYKPTVTPERLPSVQLERLPDAGDREPVSSNSLEPDHVSSGMGNVRGVGRFEESPNRERVGVVTRPTEELPAVPPTGARTTTTSTSALPPANTPQTY